MSAERRGAGSLPDLRSFLPEILLVIVSQLSAPESLE